MFFEDWKTRIETYFENARHNLQRKQQILARLKQVHQQVREVIDSGSTSATGIPWELAHGLTILDGVAAGKPLPTTVAELPTRVMDDGTLLGCRKWELLDPKWGEALVEWMEHLVDRASWGQTPGSVAMPPEHVSLAIAGDWGTGDGIAGKVAKAMGQRPRTTPSIWAMSTTPARTPMKAGTSPPGRRARWGSSPSTPTTKCTAAQSAISGSWPSVSPCRTAPAISACRTTTG